MILTNSYNSDYEFPKKLFIHWYKYSGLDEYLCWFRRVLVMQIVIYRCHGIVYKTFFADERQNEGNKKWFTWLKCSSSSLARLRIAELP